MFKRKQQKIKNMKIKDGDGIDKSMEQWING